MSPPRKHPADMTFDTLRSFYYDTPMNVENRVFPFDTTGFIQQWGGLTKSQKAALDSRQRC